MKLRAAVIGVGYLGQFHAQKLKAHAEVDLVGVCDFSYEQAQKVAGELQTNAYQNPAELVNQVDFVHIAASTQAHYDLCRIFLNDNIPVLVEKPIAATYSQALELCELAEKKNTLLSVGHIERFNPAFLFLKERAKGISFLEINRLAPFRTRGSDVSVLHDLTIHDIDLVFWLLQDEISDYSISGKKLIKDTYDEVSIRLKMKNQTHVTINNSRLNPQIVRNYRAVCKDEVFSVNTATLEAEVLKPQSTDPFYNVVKEQIIKHDALAVEVNAFVQAVKGMQKPAITAHEAAVALNYVEKFVRGLDLSLGQG